MKKFNTLAEALLMSVSPQSDAVAPVTGSTECPCQKDQFSQSADEFMNSLSPEPIQPDDNVGEVGDIQSEGDGDSSGAEFECMGEEGMKIKFNGMEVVLPRNVADELKAWMSDESEEGSEETSEEGSEEASEEGDEHEAEESPDEEKAEHAEGGSEEDEEDDKEETVTEGKKKKPPFWMKFKKGKKNKKDKEEVTESKRENPFTDEGIADDEKKGITNGPVSRNLAMRKKTLGKQGVSSRRPWLKK